MSTGFFVKRETRYAVIPKAKRMAPKKAKRGEYVERYCVVPLAIVATI